MKTTDFKNKLRDLTNDDPTLRPFICNGNPLECEIFIVGINPATKMDSPFWDYFTTTEFDKKKWHDDYVLYRTKQGKRTKLSPTRNKIDALIENTFSDHKCLETNIFSKPSASLSKLPMEARNSDVFTFLFRSIKPKALLIHGKALAKYMKNEFYDSLGLTNAFCKEHEKDNIFSLCEFDSEFGKVAVCTTKHFRLTRKSEIENAAKELLKMMEKQNI